MIIGNNAPYKIAGIGMVRIIFDRAVKITGDVRHAPNLKKNLISFGVLDSKWFKYAGECKILKVSKGVIVLMKEQRRSTKLYVLWNSTITSDVAITTTFLPDDDVTGLWHIRLGHMIENGMVELRQKGLLDGQILVN